MRVLGLDIGDKRIGVAMSDPDEILASPLTTIPRDDDEKAISAIQELVGKHGVQKIIAGLPYSMNGAVGIQASKVIAFIAKLTEGIKINIETWDERLSTVAAQRLMAQANSRGREAKLRRDAAAAAFILQGYLDSPKASR